MTALRPGCLFDRDGVINVPPPDAQRYLLRPEEFELMPGVAETIAWLNARNIPVAVITNQKGVAIGRLTREELDAIHQQMAACLAKQSAHIDSLHVCPHQESDQCTCRKPLPGLLHQAAEALHLDLSRSWVIGDKPTDIQAGQAAGCRTLRVHPEATGNAGEDVFFTSTADLPGWIVEKSGFRDIEDCKPLL